MLRQQTPWNDPVQRAILLAMLLLAILLVAGVFLEFGAGTPAGSRRPSAGRVSLMEASSQFDAAFALARPLDIAMIAEARRFDYPLGSENGAMVYDAQPFLQEGHLGADFNGIGGWDSDFGDPVYAAAEGRVLYSGWAGDGWGNFVIVAHRLADGAVVQTIYGHLAAIEVAVDDRVWRGRRIGTVGKGAGQYLAHLHFEVRSTRALHPGPGYAGGPLDRLAPVPFIEEHRGRAPHALTGAPGAPAGEHSPESLRLRLGDGEREKTVRELRQ